mgnify:CR=1 FL=1
MGTLGEVMNQMGVLTEVDMAAFADIVSHMQDGRRLRSILLLLARHLKLIKDISSRHLGLELQIRIRS